LKPWRLALLVLAAGLLQGSVAHRLAIGDAVPDLFVLAAVYVSLGLQWEKAGLAAGFIGLGRDLFFDHRLGTGALLFFVLGAFLGRLRTEIFVEHHITQRLVTLLVALSVTAAQLIGVFLVRGPAAFAAGLESGILSALYIAAIAPLFFRALNRLYPLGVGNDH